ncbi:hypothetical protein DVH26_04625 [Paenibacillus sp. H1-7]|uniref:hypothetical protein n=1 Tax=Paenibacillus sp. H1-7 TaxID=2282849 RepID=UPI001EF7F9B6|nr:hypothetical protein [Paenibacillus sp. H1-7]ULL13791.1 hypothetical protein DVH26_04625 [Paenibacillus sp. H1-7]
MAKVQVEQDLDKVTSQLSAHIWGHRFKDGQRGAEYVLEFLNILFGTGYSFNNKHYVRKRSRGLRRFIFEGVKEGAGTKGSILILKEEERACLQQAVQENDLPVLKQFLRNLEVVLYDMTGKEADRSWYARSLYPLHESLLYFELRKKTADNGEAFERNFFARGGELYFLMLAHGTEAYPERRAFIEERFRSLLTKNKIIENVVGKILSAFNESHDRGDQGESRNQPVDAILPDGACVDNISLFEAFAVELEQLLKIDLDIYEMFRLLMALVCFQLHRYILERAGVSHCNIHYFFDCLEGENQHISTRSAYNFDDHELVVKTKLEEAFEERYNERIGNDERIIDQLPVWKSLDEDNSPRFIKIMNLSSLRSRKKLIVQVLEQCSKPEDVRTKLKDVVREIVSESLKKEKLAITRTLSRDGGFATFRRGRAMNYRYTITDVFLQMLVFTKVQPKEKMEFFNFLDVLYRDYGIVIGESQAKKSGLYERSRLNARYFQDNEKALRDKLRQNGLLIEFSDATAMIQNPYAQAMEAVHA